MANAKTLQYAATLLDNLKALDLATQEAYYEMGRILSAFFYDKLYDLLGYESFKHMVEEELSFSITSAYTYRITYDWFKTLGYNKTEAVELISEFGYTNMRRVLPGLAKKSSKRVIKAKVEAQEAHIMSFSMTNAEYDEVMAVFRAFGAEFGETGRMYNASEVFLYIVRTVQTKTSKKAA